MNTIKLDKLDRRSQQIGRLDDRYRLQIPALAKQIHEATGLTIRTSD